MLIATILSLTPSFFHKFIRKMMGATIGKGVKIKFGSIIRSKKIIIGDKTTIGPFCYVSAAELSIGKHTQIKMLSIVSSRIVILGDYVHISPLSVISSDHTQQSFFKVGNHSRFFPFCWIEPGEGVEIGNNVGIGGHTLIFTHGVWPDFIDGGPIAYGPVKIEDNVWLPWRVFIMPNVTIGKNTIIGADSTVNKTIPENVIAAGSPAKIVKSPSKQVLSLEEKSERTQQILIAFTKEINFSLGTSFEINGQKLNYNTNSILIDSTDNLNKGDLVFFVNKTVSQIELENLKSKEVSYLIHADKTAILFGKDSVHQNFINYLRKYGIRLTIN